MVTDRNIIILGPKNIYKIINWKDELFFNIIRDTNNYIETYNQ